MGCTPSSSLSFSSGAKKAKDREQEDRQAKLEARMQAALKEIILHKATDDTQASFTRIILKFPALRRAFTSLRQVFKRFDEDGNGTIDREELTASLEALGAHLSEAEVNDMFSFSNMTESGVLSFKEYVLCLAIGSVLQLFPALKAYAGIDLLNTHRESGNAAPSSSGPAAASATASGVALTSSAVHGDDDAAAASPPGSFMSFPSKVIPDTPLPLSAAAVQDAVKGSALHAHGVRLVKALRVVLEAYVLFDRDASGTIDRNEVLEMIDEENSKAKATTHAKRGKEAGHNALLSKERWMELDWDGDGQITFKEFLFAFMEWVGVDDDDEDDEAGAMPDDPISARIVEREIDQSLLLPRKLSTNSQTSLRLSPEALAAASSSGAAHPAGGTHRITSVRGVNDGGTSRVAARAGPNNGGPASARPSGPKTATPDIVGAADVTAVDAAIPSSNAVPSDSDTRAANTTVHAPAATAAQVTAATGESGPGSMTTVTATVVTAAPTHAAGLATTSATYSEAAAAGTRTHATQPDVPPSLPGAIDV